METINEDSIENVLISVIIPAFNVEKYIEYCILSILDQTYENVEIIAVNDGSTDKTGEILERIQKENKKIKVIHTQNEGVSAARNRGIASSSGEYLVFVDGDDYLSSDFIEYMMSLVRETNAEFCFSTSCFTKKNEEQTKNDSIKTLPPADATALLLSPRVIVGCWNKIYKKSLIDKYQLRFSTDLFYGEGLNFITSAAQNSLKVGVGNRKVYYYRRNNEMSATSKFNIEKFRNGEKAIEIIGNKLVYKNKKIETMLMLHSCMFSLGAIVKIIGSKKKKQYLEDYKRYKKVLKKHIGSILLSRDISLYRKMLLLAGRLFPSVVTKLDIYRRKQIIKKSVGTGQN